MNQDQGILSLDDAAVVRDAIKVSTDKPEDEVVVDNKEESVSE